MDYVIINIDKESVLGSGQFGIVYKGLIIRRCSSSNGSSLEPIQIAAKMLKPNSDREYVKEFLKELKLLIFVGKHINIVELIGACTSCEAKGKTCHIYGFEF